MPFGAENLDMYNKVYNSSKMNKTKSFQNILMNLQSYWIEQGCVLLQPYDSEVGAGTFHPGTVLRVLGPDPIWKAAYIQPCRRPTDGRYGENPNRLQHYYQFQVIIQPSPDDIQELYLNSLNAIGLNTKDHDIRFVEDDWESPTLGASGLGWEIWCDGMEISQFTYFQQVGGIEVNPVASEITYGLERLAMFIQKVENVYDLDWDGIEKTRGGKNYGDIFLQQEQEFSTYNFEKSNSSILLEHFNNAEKECISLLKDKDNPEGDIEIIFTGLRPGEKLYEELLIGDKVSTTEHKRILRAEEDFLTSDELEQYLSLLKKAEKEGDVSALKEILREVISGFTPENEIVDVLSLQEKK